MKKVCIKKALASLALAALVIVICLCCAKCSSGYPTGEAFGIDVSEYQGKIDWNSVKNQTKTQKPIVFAIIRSTMGGNAKDKRFDVNMAGARNAGLVVGAYHYYRPNENSQAQAENFIRNVNLKKGDIIPVVDIELSPSVQSWSSLKIGLRNYVTLIEKAYGEKPIIYTGKSIWESQLKEDFSDCKLWVAAYSPKRREDPTVKNAAIHQFSDEIRLPGIGSKHVDGDDVRAIETLLLKWVDTLITQNRISVSRCAIFCKNKSIFYIILTDWRKLIYN